jgi:hypothetical protein
MDASSGLGGTFVATSTDTDPGAVYRANYGEFDARVDVNLPTKLPIKFFVGHNQQTRSGSHQVMTISHCATCHTYAFTRGLDERTREFIAGAIVKARALTVEYTYSNSSFEDQANPIQLQYDNAVQPATLQDIFLNRVQYEQEDGVLPVSTTPPIDKQLQTVRARLQLPGDASLVGLFATSRQTNTAANLDIDYTGVSGRLFVPFARRFSFKADARHYNLESDDVFVSVVQKVAPAGLTAGKTYEQAYPTGELDFVRESVASRTPTEVTLELGMQPAKFTFLRAGYAWDEVERTSFDVEKTTTNSYYLAARSRFGRGANGRIHFQQDFVNDPFMYENAAIPQVLQPYPSPGTPASPLTGLQYFQMYRSRQANLTSFPTSATRLDGLFTLTPSERVAMTVHYNYRSASNDDLNYSEWNRTAHMPGIDIFISPGERWTLSAGYVYEKEKLDTLFSTLAFSG